MEILSFFGRFLQTVFVPCSSDSSVQKTTQQSDGSSKVINDSQFLYKLSRKQSFHLCKHKNTFRLTKTVLLAMMTRCVSTHLQITQYFKFQWINSRHERVAEKIGCFLFPQPTLGLSV